MRQLSSLIVLSRLKLTSLTDGEDEVVVVEVVLVTVTLIPVVVEVDCPLPHLTLFSQLVIDLSFFLFFLLGVEAGQLGGR